MFMGLAASALNLLFNQTNGLPGELYTGFLKHTVAEARPVTVRNSGGVQQAKIDVRWRADGIGHAEQTGAICGREAATPLVRGCAPSGGQASTPHQSPALPETKPF
jgi:hypothetical protein